MKLCSTLIFNIMLAKCAQTAIAHLLLHCIQIHLSCANAVFDSHSFSLSDTHIHTQNNLANQFAAPFQAETWRIYFQQGGTIASLVDPTISPSSSSSPSSCQVSITVVQGGALLSTAIVLLFLIWLWNLLLACITGPDLFAKEVEEPDSTSSSARSTNADLIPPPVNSASLNDSPPPWEKQRDGEELKEEGVWAISGTRV